MSDEVKDAETFNVTLPADLRLWGHLTRPGGQQVLVTRDAIVGSVAPAVAPVLSGMTEAAAASATEAAAAAALTAADRVATAADRVQTGLDRAATAASAATASTAATSAGAYDASSAAHESAAGIYAGAAAAAAPSNFVGVSTTSVAVPSVGDTFAITASTGKGWLPGMVLEVASSGSTARVTGNVVSYNAGSGALVLVATAIVGSGTHADWLIGAVQVGPIVPAIDPALATLYGACSVIALVAARAPTASSLDRARERSAITYPTPTIYYDPSAAGSSGAGTLANPCTTPAQLAAVATGDMPGAVIGLRRGTKTTSEIKLTISSSDANRPVLIVPYGQGPAPLIDCGLVTSGWTVYSGSVWTLAGVGSYWKQIWQVLADGTEHRIAAIHDTSLANKLAKLNAAGAGYGFYDAGSLYCIPFGGVSPNGSNMIIPAASVPTIGSGGGGLAIYYPNQAVAGNIDVRGIAVRHTFGSGIMITISGTNAAITSIGAVSVTDCDVEHVARPMQLVNVLGGLAPNGGGDDAIIVYGKNNSIRVNGLRIAHNYIADCGNNAFEVAFISGGVIEYNRSVDTHSHGLNENYAAVSGILTRYNSATWIDRLTAPIYYNGTAIYCGRIAWQAGYDETTYVAATTPTQATAAQSVGNAWIGNIVIDCPADCGGAGAALIDDGCPGITFANNIFTIRSPGSSLTSPFILAALVQSSWATTLASPAKWSRNIINTVQTHSNCRQLFVSPNYNSGYAPTGDNNIYFSNASAWFDYFGWNTAQPNASTGPLTLAAWVAASGMDANSVWVSPMPMLSASPLLT